MTSKSLVACSNNAEDLLHLLYETPETNLVRMAKIYCYRIMECADGELHPVHKPALERLISEMSSVAPFDLSSNK